MAFASAAPFPLFVDRSGRPLQNGKLYFGLPDENPETSPIVVFWDALLTQPAAQPVRTIGGIPSRNGTPGQLYFLNDHSITVKTSTNQLLYYGRRASDYTLGAALARGDTAGGGAGLVGYNAGNSYPPGTVGFALNNASPVAASGSAMPTVKDAPFNASGDGIIPDQASFVSAAAAFPQIRIPPGTYRFSANTTVSTAMAMDAGAVISADAGVTVTIGGRLEAGRTLHFSGAGNFVFAPGSVDDVNAEWFGLSQTGTEASNTSALVRAWIAAFGSGLTVGRGAFPLADTTLEAKALANTSQLPNAFLGVGVDGNGGGGGVGTNVGTSFFGNSARIHFLNSSASNSDAKIEIGGFHIVGPNDDTAGVGGLKMTKLSGAVVDGMQVTGSRGNGGEFIDCYGVVVQNNTFLSCRQHGILANQRFNQSKLDSNKCIGNGKDYGGIYGNIAFSGGSGLESLGPVVINNDTSYAGANAVQYKRTNPSPSARSITINNITVASGVATANMAAAHGRATNDFISVLGATVDPNLNTFFTPQITVTSATAFTFSTTAADGVYTEATLVIGPAAYGGIYNDLRGGTITLYAEDCIGVAAYVGSNALACNFSGGYDQGFNVPGGGSGIIVFDNPSNCNIEALSLSGVNTILRIATTARKHGVNVESTVTTENGAQIQYGSIELRDGQYYSATQPTTGTWRRGDWVQNLNAAPGSPQGWYCSAAPNTFVAIDAAAGGGTSLPSQAGNAGRVLGTDGSTASWVVSASALPSQVGNAGKYLGTDGTTASWSLVSGGSLPSQTGNAGKYLTTDGTNASWAISPAGSLPSQAGQAGRVLTTDGTNASWATNLTLSNLTVATGLSTVTLNVAGGGTVSGTFTGAAANFSGTVAGANFSTPGNVSGASLNVSGGVTANSIVATAGGSSITGASSFQSASGTTANFSPGAGGSAIRAVTAGGGTTGMTIDGSSGGVALNVIGSVRFDPGTSTGTATVGLGPLTGGKPGSSTSFVWIPWIMNGIQGDILWAPR